VKPLRGCAAAKFLCPANQASMTDLAACTALGLRLSAHDRQRLLETLSSARPSLIALDNDVLALICAKLCPADRLSFLQALAPAGIERSSLRAYLRRHPALATTFCLERGCHTLCACVHQLSDALLYMLQIFNSVRRSDSIVAVTCDWSPFKSHVADVVATMHWDAAPPHARVVVNQAEVRRLVVHHLSQHLPVLRLATYNTVTHLERGVTVKVGKSRLRFGELPFHVTEVNLFAEMERDAQMLMAARPTLRAALWSEV
jgi:hypothetical protein